MKSPTSKALFRYWNELRESRPAPSRLDVDPAHFIDILSETFILEMGRADTYTFRLAGTRICEQMGYELRGLDFIELAGPAGAKVLAEDMAAIATSGQCGLFEIETHAPNGAAVCFEIIVLPLFHTQGAITRFLGAISVLNEKCPAWLGTVPLTPRALVRNELFWADGPPRVCVEETQNQSPLQDRHSQIRIVHHDRRHFRVFEGGKSASIVADIQRPRVVK